MCACACASYKKKRPNPSEQTTTTTTPTTTTNAEEAANFTTPTKNVLEQPPTSPFILRAPPSAKSKLILQNMEEVLNTVKQKHREKHKRKREEKRRAAMLADQTTTTIEATTTTTTTPNGRHVLREKTARENGLGQAKRKSSASPLKSSTPQSTIMKHFAKADPAGKAPAKATNVFELMMNARNRSMGGNANGQELAEPVEPTVTPQTKRKQLLQEWNERKGGAKRRLADEARGEYIEQKMEQRAKRLKKMLTQPAERSEGKSSNRSQELPKGRKQTGSRQEAKEAISSQEVLSVGKQTPSSQQAQTASAPTKRLRGRPRTRRLSADVETALPISPDPETLQFLSKLSSPTKKRDSLLGYFSKVESPQNAVEKEKAEVLLIEETIETPRRRPRASKTSSINAVNVEESSATTTPSGRPRRSCAAKARYDYDLEASPTKAKQPPAVEEQDSVEIIDLDSSNPAVTPKKLAPLFMRQLPKPSPDPTALRARQEFLHSGVPEKLRQEQQRQRSYEQYYEDSYELFPSIAHVGSERLDKGTSKQLPWRAEEQLQKPATVRKTCPGSITSCTASDFVANKKRVSCNWTPLPQLDNKRAMVKNWKSIFERFPTFKCYNQMREKYRHFSAIDAAQDTQPMGESFVVTRRTRRSIEQQKESDKEEDFQPPALAPNGELLFTEKYKPLLFEQVLVNLTPVQELRDFLANWNGASASNRNSQPFEDSSNDHDSSSMSASCNTMVLLGPCSSGKTNAVFALANDMNFNVLEINAGMRRTGKKLIQELQEATQSHQIRKEAKAGAAPTQQLLQKLQLNGLKARRNQGDEDVRKSLILIEDADIVFDNIDAGFTDAIYTLAASSKRPVIIVATDPNCAHLQRLMQQNMIKFQAPNALNISRFLAVLALMENCPIELDELISLYLFNNQNLRKTLMELQFFIQSGGDARREQAAAAGAAASSSPSKSPRLSTLPGVQIHQRLFEFYTCAQNVEHLIPFPVDFRLLRLNLNELLRHSTQLQSPSTPVSRRVGKRKSCSPKKAWLNKSEAQEPLQTLATFYEQLSTATLLDATLEERNDRLQPHLSEQLAHELVERAVGTSLAAKNYAYNLFDKPEQRFNLSDQLGSFQLRSSCARSLDYEPAMRAICRSEKQRASLERRSSRFYHYLRNHTNHNLSSFSLELYDAACQVLQEQPPLVE
ncbi:ATPase family AAA domain-containing protein 5 isoform X2 [Drosophila hydei]|uniref:ATPase family AAA domain-containing protein 5 isoform X2 n=1 Tax=Drosophila hydei TaxID=7224 RepID=A0A6J1M659_DROHY|nr:ATPase family AAA domain-containing protein 5 isoform X2 [Drosophila hydei]